jgi:UDP-glucuronate 4-epimerase
MKTCGIKRMVFASTSSVYGIDSAMPFKETANADRPVSIYAATKRTSEMMAYTYSPRQIQ